MAVIALLLAVLTFLGITGSSSGVLWPVFYDGADPSAIAGEPRPVRSDEWYVQTVWTISQVQLGLPVVNPVLPGGMNTTIQHDLPSLDWSVVFRPELVGFSFLPLDAAMALKWWLPPAVLLCAAYAFFLTLMRERPVMAMALAISFYLSPFIQWWHLSATSLTPAWAFCVMTACVWLTRGSRPRAGLVLAAIVAYLTVAVGMLIYVPFIVPCALVAIAFCVGVVVTAIDSPLRVRIRRLLPLAAAAASAIGVLAIWLFTRLESVQQFLGTRYPGERIQATGAGTIADSTALLAAPFSTGMAEAKGGILGANESEASTFVLVGLFLAVPIAWGWMRSVRERGLRGSDWIAGSTLVVALLFLAFYTVPGWDAVARLVFLDRTTVPRMRIGIGLLSFVMLAVFITRTLPALAPRRRFPWPIVLTTAGLAVVVYGFLVQRLVSAGSPIIHTDREWILGLGAVLVSIGAFLLARPRLGVAALLIGSVVTGVGVNPLRAGVFDLRDTPVAQAVTEIQEAAPGRWIAMGDPAIAMLTETGVPALSGYQSSPTPEMWRMIDPEAQYRDAWDRLGLVAWTPAAGETVVTAAGPDVVIATFDSCNAVAQRHIRYVVAMDDIDQECLRSVRTIEGGTGEFRIFEVTPPS
ncbi:hypothetical protein GE115_11905 [Agromyces sp. CFH 90414]|uniref:Glycosyltransferase RgtA/B/C/D-like domain-containing protein n=1 Tax=Agromyces agglutinans TaxID=2662258 RepID=A0A6I2F8J3_9MICO|nr:hypothetical protein [Agromyces agglutinans]MRG60564.1 hypothetical protein [Agromyces agglutinans]